MDEELPRVLQQLWGIEGRQRPGPKPAFHISDIARAAVKLADAGGLAAVSMSKVAAELGFTTMSLYRYVDAKDDLYVVMLEHAFGTPRTWTRTPAGGTGSPPGPWRSATGCGSIRGSCRSRSPSRRCHPTS